MKCCFEHGVNFFDNAEVYGGPPRAGSVVWIFGCVGDLDESRDCDSRVSISACGRYSCGDDSIRGWPCPSCTCWPCPPSGQGTGRGGPSTRQSPCQLQTYLGICGTFPSRLP